VKFAAFLLLAGFCFLLGGCSQMPAQMTGPQGAAEPLPMSDGGSEPQQSAGLLSRPMTRRRRNAALGRSVAPSDDIACGGKGCGCGCDYPLWLLKAEEREGQYIGCNMTARGRNGLPLSFAHYAAQTEGQDKALAPLFGGSRPAWGSLFTDWCFANAIDPKTGRGQERLGKGVGITENWLNYGVSSQPCFGALMVARQNGGYMLAFCVGALSASGRNSETERLIYLGLGVKTVSAGGAEPISQIGLSAFAAEDIAAFRLPDNYRPCKEHYKLEQTIWAQQFQARLAEKRWRQMRDYSPAEQTQIASKGQGAAGVAQSQIAGNAVSGAGVLAASAQPSASQSPQYASAGGRQLSAPDKFAAAMRDWDLEAAIERDLQAGLNRDLSAMSYV